MNPGTQFGGARNTPFLSPQEMEEVAQVFLQSFALCEANILGEQKAKVREFVGHVVLAEKPYLLVTPEGLDRAIGLVFENKHIVDFVHMLLYTFGSRWGMTDDRRAALSSNLAHGAAPIVSSELRSTPNALASRLATFEGAYHLLVANPWLVILLLLQLTVKLPSQQPGKSSS